MTYTSTKRPEVAEENILKKGDTYENTIPYEATEQQIKVLNRVWRRFHRMRDERDKARREFDGRTLREYVLDNEDAFNGIVPNDIRVTKEDWQSLTFDQLTRGKVKTMVSLVVGGAPYISLIGETKEDNKFAEDMKKVYDFEWRKNKGYYKTYDIALEACVKGTAIIEEYYKEEKQNIKEIISINQNTGQVKSRKKTVIKGGYGHVDTKLLNLLHFYPNEQHEDIKGDCIRLDYLTIDEFQKRYAHYPYAGSVGTGFKYSSDVLDIEYQRLAENKQDIVEIMKYYNEDDDEFIIIANGVWINPQEDDEPSPLPFDHKRLPFCKLIFERASNHTFYGKALPDIVSGEQETLNAILRMIIDREVLSLNKPLMLGLGAEIENYDVPGPGALLTMNGDVNQAKELPLGDASQASFMLMEFLVKRSNTNTSIDPITQGVSGGGRKTAKEATILDQNSRQMASSFQLFLYRMLLRQAELRVCNIKQFYRHPIQWTVLRDKYGNEVKDGDGKNIKRKEYRSVVETAPGKKPEWTEMDPAMCKANYHVRFEEDFYVPKSQMDRIAKSEMLLQESKMNPLLDADAATNEWLTARSLDPSKFYKGLGEEQENPEMQKAQAGGGAEMEEQLMGGNPLGKGGTPNTPML